MVNYKKILLMGCLLTASGCLQAAEKTDEGATGGSRRFVGSSSADTAIERSIAVARGTLAAAEERRIAAERDQRRAEAERRVREPYHSISEEEIDGIEIGKPYTRGELRFGAAIRVTSTKSKRSSVRYEVLRSAEKRFKGYGKTIPSKTAREIESAIGRPLKEGDIIAVGGSQKPKAGTSPVADFELWGFVENIHGILRPAPDDAGAATGGAAGGLSEPVSDGGSYMQSGASDAGAATGSSRRVSPSAPPTVAVDSLAVARGTLDEAGAATGGAAGGSGLERVLDAVEVAVVVAGAPMGEGSSNIGETAADARRAAIDQLERTIREVALTYVSEIQEKLEEEALRLEGSAAPIDEDPRNVGETNADLLLSALKDLIESEIENTASKFANNLIREKLGEAATRSEGSAAPIDEDPRNVGETDTAAKLRILKKLIEDAIEETILKVHRGN